MRTLSGALTAAQRTRRRRPYLKVVSHDRLAGVKRWRPTSWYDGSEAAGDVSACCPSDDSLIRVRIDGTTLYRSRVTSPNIGSTYSSWTNWRANSVFCAVVADGLNVYAFTVDSGGSVLDVYMATSADGGATWGAFALQFSMPATTSFIAAAVKPGGTLGFLCRQGNGVRFFRRTAGVWDAGVQVGTLNLNPTDGGVFYSGDWNCVIAGAHQTLNQRQVCTRIFGDGFNQAAGTWSSDWNEITSARTTGFTFDAVAVAFPTGVVRAVFRENFSGTNAYNRPHMTNLPPTADFSSQAWREPVPQERPDGNADYALAFNATYLFFVTSDKVIADELAADTHDYTDSVLAARLPETPLRDVRGHIDIAVTDPFATSGQLQRGTEIRVEHGYYDGATPISSDAVHYWIDSVEYVIEPRRPVLRLHLLQPWGLLANWSTPRTLQLSGLNAFNSLQRIVGRAGLDFSGQGASAASSNLTPSLVIPAGTNGLAAIRRVLDRLPDKVFARGNFVFIYEASPSDTADATYVHPQGANDHELTSGRFLVTRATRPHARVVGGAAANIIGDAFEFTAISLYYPSPLLVADRELTTGALTANRAQYELNEELRCAAGSAVAPVHCGLETGDVIAFTDARIPEFSPFTARVAEIQAVYDRDAGKYDHALELTVV